METKFFVDAMLGKLARWMRTLGYDVEYSSSIDDSELLLMAAAEGRTILTRDTLLMRRRSARGRTIFIDSEKVSEQLKQVTTIFPISEDRFLTRCLRCNALLEDIEKDLVKGKVPPYVFSTQNEFSACPVCKRVYWGATHKMRMQEDLRKLLA